MTHYRKVIITLQSEISECTPMHQIVGLSRLDSNLLVKRLGAQPVLLEGSYVSRGFAILN